LLNLGVFRGLFATIVAKVVAKIASFFLQQRGHGKSQNNHDGTPTLTPPNQSNEAGNAGRIIKSK
jgi:hypothetical protein